MENKNLDPENEQIDPQFYIPRLLYLRITRRNLLKLVSVTLIVANLIFLILGFIFIDAVYTTRKYIIGGNDFWDSFKVRNLGDGEIQYFCAFTGIFTLLTAAFNIMNQGVILKHAHFGGLRIRLAFYQWIHLIINVIMFIYSIIPLAKLTNLVKPFPAYLTLNIINFILSIVFIIFSTKLVRKEIPYMIAMKILLKHRDEYYYDFVKKKKAMINEDGHLNSEGREEEVEGENKIYIRNG